MIRIVYFTLGLLFAIAGALALDARAQSETRQYGEVVPYDSETPLPIPPLSWFAIGIDSNSALLDRVQQYCSADMERLSVWFEETHPQRLKALCGMYIVATNAVYHEQQNTPADAITFARQIAQHCGTVTIPQGEIYERLGLIWQLRLKPGHGYIDVLIDDHWETFDATVNVWYAGQRGRRMFYIPNFPGAFDHERYCYNWGCYNMRNLRVQVYDGIWAG